MQSGSQPHLSEDPPPLYTMANLIGSVIALITLTSPVYIINYFSNPAAAPSLGSDTIETTTVRPPTKAPPQNSVRANPPQPLGAAVIKSPARLN